VCEPQADVSFAETCRFLQKIENCCVLPHVNSVCSVIEHHSRVVTAELKWNLGKVVMVAWIDSEVVSGRRVGIV
jgi:hypothetical protein